MGKITLKQLLEENRALHLALKERDERLEKLEMENKLLRQKMDLLIRKVFGVSSEKLDSAQLDLFLAQAQNAPGNAWASSALEEADPPHRNKTSRHRPRHPDDLPVVEEVLDPIEVTQAPEAWRCIGQEISEQLDFEPAKFFKRRLIRRKFIERNKLDAVPVIAPLPAMLQERLSVAPGLIAHIVVSKYCDHLPLYRQEQIFWQRHRVWLPRQNLDRWMELAAEWLRPIYEQIRGQVLSGGYVQIDETPIKYLDPGHGKTRLGYFWTTSRPGGDVVYQWHTSRAALCLEKVVPVDFRGTIQCDGYSAYASFSRDKEHLQLAACWAHVRRKFYEARQQDPQRAGWVLRQIAHLYRIEKKLRDQRSGPQLRAAVRAHQAGPIYQRLHRALTQWKLTRRFLPRSGLGVAFNYALSLWPQLGLYLQNGALEIDQNLVENAIRPTALGKKNWLFIGDAEAGQRSAILYTIVESCRRRGIDPYAYLRDVLTRLPSTTNWQIKDLTPEDWARAKSIVTLSHAA